MQKDQEFLEYVVKALVDHPENVRINRTVDDLGVLLSLDVHAEDMGKVIGRSGNTAKAIRTLLRVVGMKNDAHVNLKINEPEGGRIGGSVQGDDADAGNGGYRGGGMNLGAAPSEPKSLDDAIEDLKI